MVALKKQEIETIKNKIVELFSFEHIYQNNIQDMMEEYKKFYTNSNILTFLQDEEFVNTLLSFFENNLNISLTSSKTFMHRNTLVYRIEKVKKLIGLDVRIFSEAVLVENMIVFYKHMIETN